MPGEATAEQRRRGFSPRPRAVSASSGSLRLNNNHPPINSVLAFGFAFKSHPSAGMDFPGIDRLTGIGIDIADVFGELIFHRSGVGI